MIELKNVSKTYKSKKSTRTQALKNISIKFPEKGLVFILGKSGSGKSTLLNVIGGLDKYDDGDVIINGKSTKKFKEKDFDAFRNTYMGFIFQEYNLLENYSIEQNIKISLEMQHKKATNEDITKALKQVELEDISKRKTNELSGGQKQRVAIARALIKDPEIILADEPTGNLDSQTSEQIWNILKKLSETKLVIVVSHDTESAEKYADRTIKIQDGEVVSDDGTNDIESTKEFKLQSAKLPFFYNLKMGAGSLLHKKFRLVLSTILIIFSIICFGVMLSAYTSDLNTQTLKLFEENGPTDVSINEYKKDIKYLELMKEQLNHMGDSNWQELLEEYSPIEISEKTKEEVGKNTGMKWNEVYTVDFISEGNVIKYPETLQSEENMPIYYYFGVNTADLKILKADDVSFKNLIGNKPQADDEVVISSYLADCILYRGSMAKDTNDTNQEEKEFKPKDYQEIVTSGKYVNLCGEIYVKIVGISNETEILKEYDFLKDIKTSDYWQDNLSQENREKVEKAYSKIYSEIMRNQSKIYVNSAFITKMQNEKNTIYNKLTRIKYDNETNYIEKAAYLDKSIEICTDKGTKTINSLNENEIVLSENILNVISNYEYQNTYEKFSNKYESKEEFIIQYLKDNNIIGKTIKTSVKNGTAVKDENEFGEYKIIGVVSSEKSPTTMSTDDILNLIGMGDFGQNIIYYAQSVIEPLITSKIHLSQLTRHVDNIDEMKTILKYYPVDEAKVLSESSYSETATQASVIAYLFQFVAKYGVIFFLVFTAIILMNFINSSIKFRKKEIGTLRALGCRSVDIIKMFLYESIILMIIALAIAFVVIPNIINKVNAFMTNELLMDINILNFGLTQILEITGIVLLIVVLANIIPVRRITKMKPIDAILNK